MRELARERDRLLVLQDALRDLDTGRLQELLDRLQDAQQDVDRLADQCRREVPESN